MLTFRPLSENSIRRLVAVKSGPMPDTLHIAGRTSTVVHQPDSCCIQPAIGPIARLGHIMCGSARNLPAMLPCSNLSSRICPCYCLSSYEAQLAGRQAALWPALRFLFGTYIHLQTFTFI
ncbi:hypothetical protein Y032_0465g1945 [Ancylostoma ceylanicum]|uniref:Uncharacterized protein n=1 Tax=Ancylostoma ceylanicum TaxID=53326 RepID=A0A016WZ49_9BILA|nr:hypothetical protein Y032_0465g1945 [Ancylostoma ceylanicum]